jgi:hypothetical protein
MSNCSGLSIWVGDLDCYINIDAICAENEREAEEAALELELDEIGEIRLLAGKSTSARYLNCNDITPSDWRYAVHQAGMLIGSESEAISLHGQVKWKDIEGQFIRAMLKLGNSYAVARYAKLERLDYSSAITATLPHGIRALINQFLIAEGISRSTSADGRIRAVLTGGHSIPMTAYRRTGMLQAALHAMADGRSDHPGGVSLDRERTRKILALARLHVSTQELRLSSVAELEKLSVAYTCDRQTLGAERELLIENRRSIRNWRLRHIRSLLEFYPFSIRHGLERATRSDQFDRVAIINELALAQCGVLRLRRAGRNRTRRR